MIASRRARASAAFTILEILVSMAILSILVIALSGLMNLANKTYKSSNARLDAFESARSAFEMLTRHLRQAVLHSYWGYDNPQNPVHYAMHSDLHFVAGPGSALGTGGGSSHAVFFQAPLGAAESPALRQNTLLMNNVGYFVRFGDDPLVPPSLRSSLPARKRFRLHLFQAPREKFHTYDHTLQTDSGVIVGDDQFSGFDWFRDDLAADRFLHAVADNVVAVLIRPVASDGSSPGYLWNSRSSSRPGQLHRLPDTLDVAMVVIDDASAERLGEAADDFPAALFQDPASFDSDLQQLESYYLGMTPPVDVRIFRTEISLSASNAES